MTMEETMPTAAFLRLPTELMLQIVALLEPLELASIAQTCRALKVHSYDDQIWLPLVNRNLPNPITEAKPLKSFRELFIAHHPHWFLPRYRIWFADSEPSGKLLVSRYDPQRGCIVAHAVAASRGNHTLQFWEKDRGVIIHSFNPRVSLDLNQPVLRLDVDSPRTDDQPNNYPSDRGYAPPSRYSKEVLMETFAEAGLYSSFMLCRKLPDAAISHGTQVWPPLRFPADARTRNETGDGFHSSGHRPSALSEVSEHHFRLRKWVEYMGRRSSPRRMSFTSPNGLAAALGLAGPFIQAELSSNGGQMSIRMPEDVTTYATLPQRCCTPTPQKPWQGIWCGDYSGHGCEFIVIQQPDKQDEKPLPEGMDWLRGWFRGHRRSSESSSGSYASAQEELDIGDFTVEQASLAELINAEDFVSVEEVKAESAGQASGAAQQGLTGYDDVPSGRLEAIKLTGDPNIPRGEYTFIAPEIGHAGVVRVADEEIFRGARIVRSAGHIAGRGFREGMYGKFLDVESQFG